MSLKQEPQGLRANGIKEQLLELCKRQQCNACSYTSQGVAQSPASGLDSVLRASPVHAALLYKGLACLKYLLLPFFIVGASLASDFENYLDIAPYNEDVKTLDVSDFPKVGKFYEKLASNMASGPNYAGHYFVGFVPCGSPCQGNILIDMNSGKVTDTLTTRYGMKYQLDSRLFIANPGYKNDETCPELFYEFINGNFSLVANDVQ